MAWESVSNITGKGGKKYRLTDILNINDGNAVNNVVAKNNVDFSKKTKVNTLIDSVIPVVEDVTKAIVSFDIPSSNYGFIKLVYKENDIPTSIDDGTVKNLDVDDNTATITGLEENTTYYFMIFTNKSESEPYRYKTGEIPVPEGKWVETISTCKATDDSFSMSFTEDVENWKVTHSGSDEYVWLTSLAGKTLCQITASPSDVFNNSSTYYITPSMIVAHGNNPLYFERSVHEAITKLWQLNDYDSLGISCGSANDWTGSWKLQFAGSSSRSYSNQLYGGDVLVAVNHVTQEAKIVFIAYINGGHTSIQHAISTADTHSTYYALSKFF